MELTYSLIHNLSESEKEALRYNLAYIPVNNKGRTSKMLDLADFLLSSKKCPSNKECLEGIYGKNASGTKIINLRKRLCNRILDLFIYEQEIERNEYLDHQDVEWIKAKKKIAQFYSLYYSGRGANLSLPLLEDALLTSKKFEHYLVVIECLRFKKWITGYRKGIKYFEVLQSEIKHFEFCVKTVAFAVDVYYRHIIESGFSTSIDPLRKVQKLRGLISEIKKKNKIARSNVAAYYVKILEIDCFMCLDDYVKAKYTCIELLKLINTSKAVFRKGRLSSAYCNLSRCELFLGNFNAAAMYARRAQADEIKGTSNYSVSKEQEFYAWFYGEQMNKAHLAATELLETLANEHGNFRHAKYWFFVSSILFHNGNFSLALKTLENCKEISTDKAGWDIAMRLLRIMCFIELDKNDPVSSLIESLRKQIRKYSSETKFKKRHDVILQILQQLERQNFNFSKADQKTRTLIHFLSQNKKTHGWEFLNPELIPFHKWAESKLQQKKTTPQRAM